MININLLPEELRENIDYSKKNKRLLKYFRMLIVFCLLFLSSFAFFYVFLSRSNDYYLGKIKKSEAAIEDKQDVFKEAKDFDSKIKNIEKIKSNYKYWSKFNYILNAMVPEGLYVTDIEPADKSKLLPNEKNITSDDANVQFNIRGYAKTKNAIGLFRDALDNQEGFKTVNVDLAKEDIPGKNNFTITFFLSKSALEEGKNE